VRLCFVESSVCSPPAPPMRVAAAVRLPDLVLLVTDTSCLSQERKQKQREAMVSTTPQPHCQLRVHELADIAKAAGIGLKGGAESRQKQQHKPHSVVSSRHTGPGSRQLGSRNSGTGSSWSGWTGS
jgi:hypothetical protein